MATSVVVLHRFAICACFHHSSAGSAGASDMGYLKVVAVLLGTGAGTCGFGVRSKGSVEKRIGLPVRLRASRIGEDRALGSFRISESSGQEFD